MMQGEKDKSSERNTQSILISRGSSSRSRKTVRFDLFGKSAEIKDTRIRNILIANEFKHPKICNIFSEMRSIDLDLAFKLNFYNRSQSISSNKADQLNPEKQKKIVVHMAKIPQLMKTESVDDVDFLS